MQLPLRGGPNRASPHLSPRLQRRASPPTRGDISPPRRAFPDGSPPRRTSSDDSPPRRASPLRSLGSASNPPDGSTGRDSARSDSPPPSRLPKRDESGTPTDALAHRTGANALSLLQFVGQMVSAKDKSLAKRIGVMVAGELQARAVDVPYDVTIRFYEQFRFHAARRLPQTELNKLFAKLPMDTPASTLIGGYPDQEDDELEVIVKMSIADALFQMAAFPEQQQGSEEPRAEPSDNGPAEPSRLTQEEAREKLSSGSEPLNLDDKPRLLQSEEPAMLYGPESARTLYKEAIKYIVYLFESVDDPFEYLAERSQGRPPINSESHEQDLRILVHKAYSHNMVDFVLKEWEVQQDHLCLARLGIDGPEHGQQTDPQYAWWSTPAGRRWANDLIGFSTHQFSFKEERAKDRKYMIHDERWVQRNGLWYPPEDLPQDKAFPSDVAAVFRYGEPTKVSDPGYTKEEREVLRQLARGEYKDNFGEATQAWQPSTLEEYDAEHGFTAVKRRRSRWSPPPDEQCPQGAGPEQGQSDHRQEGWSKPQPPPLPLPSHQQKKGWKPPPASRFSLVNQAGHARPRNGYVSPTLYFEGPKKFKPRQVLSPAGGFIIKKKVGGIGAKLRREARRAAERQKLLAKPGAPDARNGVPASN